VDQPRERLRLAPEEAKLHLVGEPAAAQDLDCDAPLGVALLRLVDDAHAALAEDREDLELADVCRRGKVGVGFGKSEGRKLGLVRHGRCTGSYPGRASSEASRRYPRRDGLVRTS
jgi:hypothetical protein